MEKRKIWLGMLIMLLAFGMMVISCEITSDDEKIIGVWEYKYYDFTMRTLTFKSNNKVDIYSYTRGTKTFSYKLDGNKIKLTDSNGDSYTGRYKFDYSDGESKLIISGFSVSIHNHLYLINETYIKKE